MANIHEQVREINRKANALNALLSGTPGVREITRASKINDEIVALEIAMGNERHLMEVKSANNARMRALGGSWGAPEPWAQPRSLSPLRHITGESRAEAAAAAYAFGQWVRGYVFNVKSGLEWCKSNIKTVAEDTEQTGGALVPPGVDNALIDLRERYGVARGNFHITRMTSDYVTRPRRVSGATVYWVGEGEAPTESTPQWDQISLTSKKLGSLTAISGEIDEDSIINLGDEVAGSVSLAFAQREDDCGFIGDGTSTYRGMTGIIKSLTNLSATVGDIAGLEVATGTDYATSFTQMTLNDFQRTMGKLPAHADRNAKWYMHKRFFHNVAQGLASAAGLPTERDADGPLFLGYPVRFVQQMAYTPAINTVVALYGDLEKAATFGDRRQIRLMKDPYSLVTTGQVRLICFERFDLAVNNVGNASSVAADRVPGPVTALITPAS